ncbi:MAG TPA: hypothetical protein ENN63_01970 [Bacteroidetes bacterium]|nr:hypothetical protein [Bacteroidota bacterium]
MHKGSHFIRSINPHLFWDVDISRLDAFRSRRLVIERVFSLGNTDEIRRVLKFYGKEEIIHILTNLNYLDKKTLNFAATLLHVPKEKFKCTIRKQSTPPHWDY